ncbi:MAG: hypothetical protein DCC71_07180, partial [Proteobacteria bacterium]
MCRTSRRSRARPSAACASCRSPRWSRCWRRRSSATRPPRGAGRAARRPSPRRPPRRRARRTERARYRPRVRLRDLGEFGLIARIEKAAGRARGAGVVLGIGDDAAVLRARCGEDVVVSTDAVVEGVHFRWEWEPARAIGRRAMAAALSDLAAMGARPLGVVAALAAPPDLLAARA